MLAVVGAGGGEMVNVDVVFVHAHELLEAVHFCRECLNLVVGCRCGCESGHGGKGVHQRFCRRVEPPPLGCLCLRRRPAPWAPWEVTAGGRVGGREVRPPTSVVLSPQS